MCYFQVDIEVNGKPVKLCMKLGEAGEAFFVQEAENRLQVRLVSCCITCFYVCILYKFDRLQYKVHFEKYVHIWVLMMDVLTKGLMKML